MRVAFLATVLCLSTAALCCAAPQALAQRHNSDERAARTAALEQFKQGATAYKAGDYDAALKFFRRAQALYGHEPLIILALAKTLDGAKEHDKALKYYQLFLNEAPADDNDRPKTVARIQAIKALLAAMPATLVLMNLPSAARVSVNGKEHTVDHRSALSLPAGSYDVLVTMKPRLPFELKALTLEPGATREVEVVLLEPVDPSTLPHDHTWTWAAGTATGVAALTAGAFGLKSYFVRGDWADMFDGDTGQAKASAKASFGCTSKQATPEKCQALVDEGNRLDDEAKSFQQLAWITGGVALGLGFATAVAYFAAPVQSPAAAAPTAWRWQVGPWLAPGQQGAALTLRF